MRLRARAITLLTSLFLGVSSGAAVGQPHAALTQACLSNPVAPQKRAKLVRQTLDFRKANRAERETLIASDLIQRYMMIAGTAKVSDAKAPKLYANTRGMLEGAQSEQMRPTAVFAARKDTLVAFWTEYNNVAYCMIVEGPRSAEFPLPTRVIQTETFRSPGKNRSGAGSVRFLTQPNDPDKTLAGVELVPKPWLKSQHPAFGSHDRITLLMLPYAWQ